MIEPQHSIEIGGVTRRLRYRFSDWARAERIAETGLRSGWGIPITTPAQMLPKMLLVGLNHEMPGLTLDSAAELIDYDTEDAIMAACVRAVYDYEPAAQKKMETAEQILQSQGLPSQELTMLLGLIRSTSGTDSKPFAVSPSTSTKRKSKT